MTTPITTNLTAMFSQLMRLRFTRVHASVHSLGLHPGQLHLLRLVMGQDGMSQIQLATLLFIKPSTVTVMVSRLVSSGMLRRTRDKKDRRLNRVHITEKGKALLVQASVIIKEIDQEIFDGLSEQDLNQILGYATKMRNNLLQNQCAREDHPCDCF